jgi:hypothetical protein
MHSIICRYVYIYIYFFIFEVVYLKTNVVLDRRSQISTKLLSEFFLTIFKNFVVLDFFFSKFIHYFKFIHSFKKLKTR